MTVHVTAREDVTYPISGNDLRVAMGSGCVVVGAGLPHGYQHPVDLAGGIINEFGMKMRQGPVYLTSLFSLHKPKTCPPNLAPEARQ